MSLLPPTLSIPRIATPSINDMHSMSHSTKTKPKTECESVSNSPNLSNNDSLTVKEEENELTEDNNNLSTTNNKKGKKKKLKKRCAALDYLSDSPKKKRGRKVKDKKNLPPIQKQPFFLVFPDLRLKCPQCDHIAICQGTLVQHLRTHPESRKCPVCSKKV